MPRAHPTPNLPSLTGVFVGRDAELLALRRQLEDHRLSTLVGPAGVGKTRLSLAAARAFAEAPESAVSFCDLSEAHTREELCEAVVHSLDIKGARASGRALVERVGQQLAQRGPLLLVLDNFEQLVDDAAEILAEWLRAAPQARLLVTSRVRLQLDGECVYVVEPLSSAEAEALFLDRVRLVRPGYSVSAGDADVLAEVLRGLDNLPLAIELAAPRMRVMGIRELRDHLSRSLTLLSSGRRDAPARQSSLEAALSWSWRQLRDIERSALIQCTRFRGGFDLEAADAVIDLGAFDDEVSTLDVIQALVDQSMVSVRDLPAPLGGRRLSLLRTIDDFVRAQAAASAGEAKPAGEDERQAGVRHARYFAELGEREGDRWRTDRDPMALARLRIERDNLLSAAKNPDLEATLALRAALCLHPVVATWGPFQPQLDLLEARFAAATSAGLDTRTEALALVARGRLEMACLGVLAAEETWKRAIEVAQRAEDPELEGRARHGLAAVLQTRGRLDEALVGYEEALVCLRLAANRRALCFALLDRAILLGELGSTRAALDSVDEAAAVAGSADDLTGAVFALRGSLHLDTGELDAARSSLRAALEVTRGGDYRLVEGQVLGELAQLALFEGAADEVTRAFEEALAVLEGVGDRRMSNVCWGYRAVAEHLHFDLSEACAAYGEQQRIAKELGCGRFGCFLGAWSAMAQADRGRLDLCGEDISRAAASIEEQADPFIAAALDLARAQLQLARAREAFAGGHVARATTLLRGARAAARVRPSTKGESRELRLTRLLFDRALLRSAEELGTPELARESRVQLTVDSAGRWFRIGDGAVCDTGRQRAVRALLVALARAYVESPGVPVSLVDLVATVWAGDRMRPSSAKNRLHVTLSKLRKTGLREHILTEETGYLIDPAIDLFLDEEEVAEPGAARRP